MSAFELVAEQSLNAKKKIACTVLTFALGERYLECLFPSNRFTKVLMLSFATAKFVTNY